MAVAQLDLALGRLTFCGVGNVDAYLWSGSRIERPISHRGIVGSVLPRLQAFSFPLVPDWLLLLHTDGIRTRFDLKRMPEFQARDPQALVDVLLHAWARLADDSTAVAACAA
jgi:hypothetical protein